MTCFLFSEVDAMGASVTEAEVLATVHKMGMVLRVVQVGLEVLLAVVATVGISSERAPVGTTTENTNDPVISLVW